MGLFFPADFPIVNDLLGQYELELNISMSINVDFCPRQYVSIRSYQLPDKRDIFNPDTVAGLTSSAILLRPFPVSALSLPALRVTWHARRRACLAN